jgi:hypothetical protein
MSDQEWLQKVYVGYKFYAEQKGKNSDIEDFISWLYVAYGLVPMKTLEKKD